MQIYNAFLCNVCMYINRVDNNTVALIPWCNHTNTNIIHPISAVFPRERETNGSDTSKLVQNFIRKLPLSVLQAQWFLSKLALILMKERKKNPTCLNKNDAGSISVKSLDFSCRYR